MSGKKKSTQKVDSMPGIMVEHSNKTELQEIVPREGKRKTLLWTAVILISGVVFIMWLLNTRALLFDFKYSQSPQEDLFGKAKKELKESLDEVSVITPEGDKKGVLEQIENILKEFASTTTSVVTSTTSTVNLNQNQTTTISLEE